MARKPAAAAAVEEAVTQETVEPVEAHKETRAPSQKRAIKVKPMSPDTLVTVRNGYNGKLVYKSKKFGEVFEWENFGDEQEIELQELKNAKNSSKAFFENNWFLIEDPEVVEILGIERFYRGALSYEELDSLFAMSADEIPERIAKLPKGQRASVIYRSRQLIREGAVDSLKVINALEKSLGVELIEK